MKSTSYKTTMPWIMMILIALFVPGMSVFGTPVISSQTGNQIVCEGLTASFSVTATGTSLTYQWYDSSTGLPVPGGTTATLNLVADSAKHGHAYYCTITESSTNSSVDTDAAYLFVNEKPRIDLQPVSAALCANNQVTLSANWYLRLAIYNGQQGVYPTYTWQKSTDSGSTWTDLSNSNSNNYNVSASDAGSKFRCVINNICNTPATSQAASISLIIGVSISGQPAPQTVYAGQQAYFDITAAGDGLAYQWQVSTNSGSTWNNISGATGTSYNFTASAGENNYQYRCVVNGTCGTLASSGAVLTVDAKPNITTQPAGQTVCAGQTATFNVTASAVAIPITYQWQVSNDNGSTWSTISGATAATYAFTTAASQNGYLYRCAVSNSAGTTTSNSTTLTVNSVPAITVHPGSQTICEATNANFSVTATGGQLTYQWQTSVDGGNTWLNINGANSALFTVTASTGNNANMFRCVATNPCGTVTSNSATLTTIYPPQFINQPPDISTCNGKAVSFCTSTLGAISSTQWQKSVDNGVTWTNVSGSTCLNVTATLTLNNAKYHRILNGTCGSATSRNALLTVGPALSITTQPSSQSACDGSAFSFGLTASGTNLSHQWQQSTNNGSSWANISGAAAATYGNIAAASMNGYQYRNIVSSPYCSVTSSAAKLAVGVLITAQPGDRFACAGENASLSVTALGTGLTYQWQQSTDAGATWNNLTGANTATYALTTSYTMNGNLFRCTVASSCGTSAASDAMQLTVYPRIHITSSPASISVSEGQTASFTVGTDATYIEWYVSYDGGTTWNLIDGFNDVTYSFSAIYSMNGYKYMCVAYGICDILESSPATLTVTPLGQFSWQPWKNNQDTGLARTNTGDSRLVQK